MKEVYQKQDKGVVGSGKTKSFLPLAHDSCSREDLLSEQ